MHLKSIGGTSFLGYKKFSVEIKPGLTLIDGVNHHYATASSNGSGKSTLMEAVAVCSFGRTIRAMGKDDIIHEGDLWASVWNEYIYPNGRLLRVERYRKHPKYGNDARVLLSDDDASTGRYLKNSKHNIERRLGFDFDIFKRSVIIHSRITESFVSLNDRYLKMITEKLVGLPDFDPLIGRVKDSISSIESDLESCEDNVGHLSQSLLDERNRIKDLRARSDKHEAEAKGFEKFRKGQIKDLMAKTDDANRKIKIYDKKIRSVSEEIVKVTNGLSEVKTLHGKYSRMESNAQLALAKINYRLRHFRAEKQKYIWPKDSVCPECGQTVSSDHIKQKVAVLDKNIVPLIAEEVLVRTNHATLQRKTERAYAETNKIVDTISTLREKRAEFNLIKEKAVNEIATNEKLLKFREKQYAGESNPYTVMISACKKKIIKLKSDLEETKARIIKRKKRLLYYEFWRKGFGPGGIRSYILDAVTPVINRNVNIYLGVLTDEQMRFNMSTVTENKDGSFADKFSIEVTNLSGSSKFEGDSDGEVASVDLAVNFAMSDILESRIPGGFGFLFVDQAIDLLDTIRGRKAIQLLYNKLDTKWCKKHKVPSKRSIWLTTHREALKGLVENRILVEKCNKICRIVES